MEEEKINVEQPESVIAENGIAADESCPLVTEEGSTLEKFADVSALEKAYKELQSAFTKKCQELCKLKSESEEKQPKEGDAGAAGEEKADVVSKPITDNSFNKEEIIKKYLLEMAGRVRPPAVITTNNDFCVADSPGPKSIYEVGKIAEEFFLRREK